MNTHDYFHKPPNHKERVDLEYWRNRFNESVTLAQREIENVSRHNQSVITRNMLSGMGIR